MPELVERRLGTAGAARRPAALAAAIEELLALPAAERAAMGAAGRASVLERFDQRSQARGCLTLIGAAARP